MTHGRIVALALLGTAIVTAVAYALEPPTKPSLYAKWAHTNVTEVSCREVGRTFTFFDTEGQGHRETTKRTLCKYEAADGRKWETEQEEISYGSHEFTLVTQ